VVAVDHRLLRVERAPEVVDVLRVGAGDADLERQEARVLGDDDGDGAGALGRLTRRLEAVAGDVGAYDERLAAARRAGGDPVERREQAGGAAEAGVLGLEDAALGRQAEQPVQIGGDGLGVIDGGLGADDAQADLRRIDAGGGEHTPRRLGPQRHRVLVMAGHRHAGHAEAVDELGRGYAAGGRQIGEVEVSFGYCERDGVDSDGRHAASPAECVAREQRRCQW
jgi:hypothetical protein